MPPVPAEPALASGSPVPGFLERAELHAPAIAATLRAASTLPLRMRLRGLLQDTRAIAHAEKLRGFVHDRAKVTVREAARQLRPELEERSAARWLRRRLTAIGRGLTALVTSLPALLGTAPTLSAVGAKLGAARGTVLMMARVAGGALLSALPTPLGFRHRPTGVGAACTALQHTMGPAPERALR